MRLFFLACFHGIVFSEPSETFIQRVRNHPSVIITGSLNDLPMPSGMVHCDWLQIHAKTLVWSLDLYEYFV